MQKAKRTTTEGTITRVRVLTSKEGVNKGTRVRIEGRKEEIFLNPGFGEEYAVVGNKAELVFEKRIAGITGYTKGDTEILHGIHPESGEYRELTSVDNLPEGDERIAKFEAGEQIFLKEGDKLRDGLVDFYSESKNAQELANKKATLEMELEVKAKAAASGAIQAKIALAKEYVTMSPEEQAALMSFAGTQF